MTAEGIGEHKGTKAAPPEHFVALLKDLPLGHIQRFEVAGRTIGVLRTVDEVFAIGNRCPHQGGPMCQGRATGTMLPSRPDEYIYGEDGLIVQCPWHAYEFSVRTGESVGGVISGRVPVFQTIVRDGAVYCTLRRLPPVGVAG